MKKEFKNNYIKVEFSYNGNLGKLQNQTEANLKSLSSLYDNGIIDYSSYKEIRENIVIYFIKESQRVCDYPMNYLYL